jgi:hypothetical protein
MNKLSFEEKLLVIGDIYSRLYITDPATFVTLTYDVKAKADERWRCSVWLEGMGIDASYQASTADAAIEQVAAFTAKKATSLLAQLPDHRSMKEVRVSLAKLGA